MAQAHVASDWRKPPPAVAGIRRQASLAADMSMCQVRLQKTSLRKAGSCPWNGPVAWETFCKKALLVWKAEINLSGHTIHGVLASMCAKRPQPLELELPCPVLTVTDCRHCSDILHGEPTLPRALHPWQPLHRPSPAVETRKQLQSRPCFWRSRGNRLFQQTEVVHMPVGWSQSSW